MSTTQLQKTVSSRIIQDGTQTFIESFSATTTITQYVEKQILLATGVTNQSIDLTPLTSVKEIYIESEQQISIKLNGNGAGVPSYVIKDIWYLSTNGITSIYLSNNSGTNSTVKIIIA